MSGDYDHSQALCELILDSICVCADPDTAYSLGRGTSLYLVEHSRTSLTTSPLPIQRQVFIVLQLPRCLIRIAYISGPYRSET